MNQKQKITIKEGDKMKLKVKFGCGHSEIIDAATYSGKIQNKIKWFGKYGICSTCYRYAQKNGKKNYRAREEIK